MSALNATSASPVVKLTTIITSLNIAIDCHDSQFFGLILGHILSLYISR